MPGENPTAAGAATGFNGGRGQEDQYDFTDVAPFAALPGATPAAQASQTSQAAPVTHHAVPQQPADPQPAGQHPRTPQNPPLAGHGEHRVDYGADQRSGYRQDPVPSSYGQRQYGQPHDQRGQHADRGERVRSTPEPRQTPPVRGQAAGNPYGEPQKPRKRTQKARREGTDVRRAHAAGEKKPGKGSLAMLIAICVVLLIILVMILLILTNVLPFPSF